MSNEKETETTVVEEKKSNKAENLLNEFVEKHLEGTRYVRDFELTISDETKTFGIATNNILYQKRNLKKKLIFYTISKNKTQQELNISTE